MSLQNPARPTLLRESQMLTKGKIRILHSGDCLTTQDVAELGGLTTVTACSELDAWVRDGRIFTVEHEGIRYVPRYGLDPSAGYRPLPSLAPVIECLAIKKEGWGMAFWFGSSNSYLGGRMPKDVLPKDPQAALDAAKDEIAGIFC